MDIIFVRSGFIYYLYGSARDLSFASYYWSTTTSTVYDTGSNGIAGYYLRFNTSNVNSSRGPNDRYFAFPIRCLAY